MKSRNKKILYSILSVNILIIICFEYYIYVIFPNNVINLKVPEQFGVDKAQTSDIPYENYVPLYYGDQIEDHTMQDIENNRFNVSSATNCFKFIFVERPDNDGLFNSENILLLLKINDLFQESNLHCLYLYSDLFNDSQKKRLSEISMNKNLRIFEVSDELLNKTYKMQGRASDIYILIDDNNKVRFVNRWNDVDVIKSIIEKELNRKL